MQSIEVDQPMLTLLDILEKTELGTARLIVYRHTPTDAKPDLLAQMTTLALHEPELIATYQSVQNTRVRSALLGNDYIASFSKSSVIGALFLGVYKICGKTDTTYAEFAERPAQKALVSRLGVDYHMGPLDPLMVVENKRVDILSEYIGRLEIEFPHRASAQYPTRDRFPVRAIHQEPVGQVVRKWDEINLAWTELQHLSRSLEIRLGEWRGIYLITDLTDGARYVGKADGPENILARWRTYAATGHGDNILLRKRDPSNFRFTILELLAPTAPKEITDALEISWKRRLHSRHPTLGLNAN